MARTALGGQTNAAAWSNTAAIPFRGGIPYSGTTDDPARGWEADPAGGYGDPCVYWFGGDWRLPTSGPAGWYSEGGAPFGNTTFEPVTWPLAGGADYKNAGEYGLPMDGVVGGKNGSEDWAMFMSQTGSRINNSGQKTALGGGGGPHWSSSFNTNTNLPISLGVNRGAVYPNKAGSPAFGFAVRCVK